MWSVAHSKREIRQTLKQTLLAPILQLRPKPTEYKQAPEDMTTTFESFVEQCKTIAKNLHTICEVKEYTQYGWAAIAFMTDKFGGTYVNLHYDLKTNEVVNWYGHKDERKINDLSFLSYFVKEEMKKEISRRNLTHVYEMVNAEY